MRAADGRFEGALANPLDDLVEAEVVAPAVACQQQRVARRETPTDHVTYDGELTCAEGSLESNRQRSNRTGVTFRGGSSRFVRVPAAGDRGDGPMSDAGMAFLERQIRHYADECDVVLAAHRVAGECLDLEAVLAVGLKFHEVLADLDRVLHEAWLDGTVPCDPASERALRGLYASWLAPHRGLQEAVERFEREGFVVAHADAYRCAVSQARGAILDDSSAFDPEFVDQQSARALDEFRRGECTEA
jgi:hypothetical protein